MTNHPLLPPGWEWTTIGEVADTTSGGTPSRKKPSYYGGDIPWIKSGELRDNNINEVDESITEAGLKNSSAKIFPKGTPVVALYGATVGRTGILGLDAATNQAVCAMFAKQNAFTAKFMMYWLRYQRQTLIDMSSGGAQPNISQTIVKAFHFPLPPLAEQRRIVEAIETHFSRLEAGVASLRQAQARLERYRASVLKAACEGRLVPQDSADEPADQLLERILQERRERWAGRGKYKEPAPPISPLTLQRAVSSKTSPSGRPGGLPELTVSWVWANVNQLGEVIGGLTKNSKRKSSPLKMPYLRVANVYANELRLDDVQEVGVWESELERILLQKGDLLVVEGNGSIDQIGRVAIWNGSISPCVHQNHIIKVRFEQVELAKFVLLWLLSKDGREQITRVASSTSGLYTLSLSKVSALPVPLPPLAEQQRIVAEVERRLSVEEEVGAAIEANLKRAERLRQAILKRAFAGKLVPQDPADEPAAVLLARIRAAKSGIKKGRQLELPGV